MILNVSDEEKYEIVKNNSHKWKPFSKLEDSYLQFLNVSLIFKTIIETIDKSIVISYDNTMDHNDYTYDMVERDFRNNWIETQITPSYDGIETIIKVIYGGCDYMIHSIRDKFWKYHKFVLIKIVEQHIINELKNTNIPPVLQKIMIEYAF